MTNDKGCQWCQLDLEWAHTLSISATYCNFYRETDFRSFHSKSLQYRITVPNMISLRIWSVRKFYRATDSNSLCITITITSGGYPIWSWNILNSSLQIVVQAYYSYHLTHIHVLCVFVYELNKKHRIGYVRELSKFEMENKSKNVLTYVICPFLLLQYVFPNLWDFLSRIWFLLDSSYATTTTVQSPCSIVF